MRNYNKKHFDELEQNQTKLGHEKNTTKIAIYATK